jgi:serine/threonine-protein kinase
MAEAERVKTDPPPVPGSATPNPASGVAAGPSASAPAPTEVDPLLGKVIDGRFRVLSLLARGGMGRVYRAEQIQLGRVCAVKVLHPKYTGDRDPEFARRFFLEAKIASQLTHPNTVTIFDYGQDKEEDIFFMAMELLEGVTLHRAVRTEAPFPAERVAYIGRQVCRSLREAHRLGVIHRDLKPANVILTVHGDEPDFVKVLDFGLVKQIEGAIEELTQTGLFMGSPKYMAPEAIRGDPVDGRADIYSLGVMMYEMACGKVPFEKANSLGTLMAHVNDAPPTMESMCPGLTVPAELSETIFACLAKEPDQRLGTMDDVLAALKRVSPGAHGHTGEYRTGTPPAVSQPGHMSSGHMSSRPPPSISGAQSARPVSLTAQSLTAPSLRDTPLESIFETESGHLDRPGQLVEPPLGADGKHETGSSISSGVLRPSKSGMSAVSASAPPPLSAFLEPPSPERPELADEPSGDASDGSGSVGASRSLSGRTPARRERNSALWGIAGGAAVVLAVAAIMWARGDTRDDRYGSIQPLAVVTARGGSGEGPATSATTGTTGMTGTTGATSSAVAPAPNLPRAEDLPLAAPGAAPAPAMPVTFRVVSEPPGAQVRESGVELCTATPCDVLFRGAAASKGTEHKLLVMRAGYRNETVAVHPEEATVTVHLTRAFVGGGGAAPPAGTPNTASGNASNASNAGTTKAPPASSSGFKELPY